MNRRDFLISSAVTAGWLSGATALPAWAAARATACSTSPCNPSRRA